DKSKLARGGEVRPRIVENGVGRGGYSGERSDAKSQSEHRGDVETGCFAELPQSKAKVLKPVVHFRLSPRLVDGVYAGGDGVVPRKRKRLGAAQVCAGWRALQSAAIRIGEAAII